MYIYGIALTRCVFVQRYFDFGAAYSIWVASAVTDSADTYWAATNAAVLVAEYAFPPSLGVIGTLAVVAHCIVTSAVETRQIGAIIIACLSLFQKYEGKWPSDFLKKRL